MDRVKCPYCKRDQYHAILFGTKSIRCSYCKKEFKLGAGRPFSNPEPMSFPDYAIFPKVDLSFDDSGSSNSTPDSGGFDGGGGGDFGRGGASGDF